MRFVGVVASAAFAASVVGSGAAPTRAGDAPADAQSTEPASPTLDVPPVVTQTDRPMIRPDDPTAFTTVIHPRDYAGEGQSIADLLAQTEGVQVRRFGGPGQPAELSIRGSSANQVVILLDGVRLNGAQTDAVDLSSIPVDLIERIEVTRGGGSVESGSGAIGGVVNLVSKRGAAGERSELNAEIGSFGTYATSALHSRSIGPYELSGAYSGFSTDGDWKFERPVIRSLGQEFRYQPSSTTRLNNESEIQGGNLRVGRDVGERTHVALQDNLVYTSRGVPGLDSGSGVTAGQREHAHERRARNLASLATESTDLAGTGVDGSLLAYHRYERVHYRDPDESLCGTIDTEDTTDTPGGRLALERRATLLGVGNRASVAGDLWQDRLRSNGQPDRDRWSGGVVVQDELAVLDGGLRVVPAIRYDDTEGSGGRWLPRVGAMIEPGYGLRLKANYEHAYRAPSFDELYLPDRCFLRGNPNLRPEEATNADAGFELALEGTGPLDQIRAGGAWFHQDVRDSIVFVLVSQNTIAAVNTGPATIDGFEASLAFRLFEWVRVSGNGTFVDATLDRTDTPLPGRARYEASARVVVGPPSGLVKLVGELLYTDRIPVTDTGSTYVPERVVYDASLIIDLAQLPALRPHLPFRALRVSFIGRNLTNRSVRDGIFLPQPGRQLAVRVEARL